MMTDVAAFTARHLHFVEITIDEIFVNLELLCFDLVLPTCKLCFLLCIVNRIMIRRL